MSVKYSQSIKTQAVEKALSRPEGTGIKQIPDSLGVGAFSLQTSKYITLGLVTVRT